MRKLCLNYLVIAALALSAAFTSCGGGSGSGGSSGSSGKSLSGTYDGYFGRYSIKKFSYTFSGNKYKLVIGEHVEEGVYELVEEYKDDEFSRGTLIFTHREGKNEWNYTLEGKKGEILSLNRIDYSWNNLIKGGKSSKIPNGTYSSLNYSYTFSGSNVIMTYYSNKNEYLYEFIVGYEDKGSRKGYILYKDENGEITSIIRCDLEKDKLTFGSGEVLQKSK